MADRYPGKAGRTEYGGGDGLIQRDPSGAVLPLQDIADGVGRRAQLMRIAGMHDFDAGRTDEVGFAAGQVDTSQMSSAQLEAYLIDKAESERRKAERAALRAKTNGYIDEAPETGEGVA